MHAHVQMSLLSFYSAMAHVTKWMARVSPILLSPLFITPRQNYNSCTARGNPNSLECIKRNLSEIILLHTLFSQNALRVSYTYAYITLKGQEVGKGLPCLRTREWANERVKECSIRRLLGWWRGGERGQTALFIAKQLPVRYFCCNGRRKMKHFTRELIKGPYDKRGIVPGFIKLASIPFSFSLSPSLAVCLFFSAMLPVWDIARQWNMELKGSQQSTSC